MSSLMARQLADVPDEIRAVPAPPLPVIIDPYHTRFADPDVDAEQISGWMNRPHLVASWHYNYPPAEWHRHLEIQFEGNYSRPYIATMHGQPILYYELFRTAQDDIGTAYEADPYDIGLHAAILEPELVEKGHGQAMFHPFAVSVFRSEPQCRRIMGDTPVDRASEGRRFWERTGGVLVGEPYIARLNQHRAIFAWPRTPADVPRLRATPNQQ